jgi:hypothetical protein
MEMDSDVPVVCKQSSHLHFKLRENNLEVNLE